MPLVKKLVYDYALDEVLKKAARLDMPENFITHDLNSAPNLQIFLNDMIQPVRNRIPHFPLSREEVTKKVVHGFSHDESHSPVNIQLQQHVQPQQLPEQLPEQLAQPIQTEQPLEQLPAQAVQLVRPQEQTRQLQRPRLFSLFPNPSFK
ncbi:hypothetical protein RMATCC62417_16680 [Rhizopus microsporus]|nr:hypothetical protein RMATCC62417_16680 [Rhizopus microsporus]